MRQRYARYINKVVIYLGRGRGQGSSSSSPSSLGQSTRDRDRRRLKDTDTIGALLYANGQKMDCWHVWTAKAVLLITIKLFNSLNHRKCKDSSTISLGALLSTDETMLTAMETVQKTTCNTLSTQRHFCGYGSIEIISYPTYFTCGISCKTFNCQW